MKRRTITARGKTLTLTEWAKITGLNPETIRSRIDHQGMTPDEALAKPAAAKFDPRKRAETAAPKPVPAMRRHTSGQAYVRWSASGRRHVRYLGVWESAEAAAAYRRFAAEWHTSAPRDETPADGVYVGHLVARYLEHCRAYYVKDGKATSEIHGQRAALRFLAPYFKLRVSELRAKHLKEIQATMSRDGADPLSGEPRVGMARTTINQNTWRIARMVRWAVGEDLAPGEVAVALESVPNLQPGRAQAEDADPVGSVSAEHLAATVPHLDPSEPRRRVLTDLIEFLERTGMRPGEALAMRADQVDRTADVWAYRAPNKNMHRAARRAPRVVWSGPRAQRVLAPYLEAAEGNALVWRMPNGKNAARTTTISRNRFAELIRRACDAAGIPRWHPHQLRHNRATEVAHLYESDEHAAAAIGDTPHVAATVYADPSDAVAKRIARATG